MVKKRKANRKLHYCPRVCFLLLFFLTSLMKNFCLRSCDCHTMVKGAGQDLMLLHSAWSPLLFWWELWVGRRSQAWVATLAFRRSRVSLVQRQCLTAELWQLADHPEALSRELHWWGKQQQTQSCLSDIFHALVHPTLAQCLVALCPECACPALSLPDLLHRDPPSCPGSHIQHSSGTSCLLLVLASLFTIWDHLGKLVSRKCSFLTCGKGDRAGACR